MAPDTQKGKLGRIRRRGRSPVDVRRGPGSWCCGDGDSSTLRDRGSERTRCPKSTLTPRSIVECPDDRIPGDSGSDVPTLHVVGRVKTTHHHYSTVDPKTKTKRLKGRKVRPPGTGTTAPVPQPLPHVPRLGRLVESDPSESTHPVRAPTPPRRKLVLRTPSLRSPHPKGPTNKDPILATVTGKIFSTFFVRTHFQTCCHGRTRRARDGGEVVGPPGLTDRRLSGDISV